MFVRHLSLLLCILFMLSIGCSDDDGAGGDGSSIVKDGSVPPQDNGAPSDGPGPTGDGSGPTTLPAVPQQSGVVYVAHFGTTNLRIYRTDGSEPAEAGTVDLGPDKVTHDMALDPYNDLLFIVADVQRTVDIYKVFRPSGPGQPVQLPVKQASVSITDNTPRFVKVDPQHKRLYVVTSPPGGGLVTEHLLMAYDISDPASPKVITGSPFSIPVTVSLTVDGARQVLFLVESPAQKLHGFDLRGDQLTPMDGNGLDLQALFPQENQTVFAARELVADPFRNRLYAARRQGILSELIVLEYPAVLPAASVGYSQLAKLDEVKVVADPFDVDTPHDQRPNLLDAFQPAIDLDQGHIFLSSSAYMGMGPGAIMTAIASNLTLGKGCEDFEGFGCWYRHHFEGTEGPHQLTDGATCVDWVHRVVVGTSIDTSDETNPGGVHFFRYQPDLSMSKWLPASGTSLAAGGHPVAAVCH